MKKLTFLFLSFSILFVGFTACSDSDDNEDKTPITRVEASSDIDLSKYSDLVCTVNGEDYDYVITGNKAVATPKKDGQLAYVYTSDPNIMDRTTGIYMNLSSSNLLLWGMNKQIDQSTFSKMMTFDVLVAQKGGALPSVITGLKIEHQFNMLSFTVKNLPKNAEVTVKGENDSQTFIIPYLTSTGSYQCIPNLGLEPVVSIKVGDIKYQTSNIYDAIASQNRAVFRHFNNFYSFEVVYNADAENNEEKLAIKNGTVAAWVNQQFIAE